MLELNLVPSAIAEVGWNSFAQSDILKLIFVALNIEFVAAFVKSYWIVAMVNIVDKCCYS